MFFLYTIINTLQAHKVNVGNEVIELKIDGLDDTLLNLPIADTDSLEKGRWPVHGRILSPVRTMVAQIKNDKQREFSDQQWGEFLVCVSAALQVNEWPDDMLTSPNPVTGEQKLQERESVVYAINNEDSQYGRYYAKSGEPYFMSMGSFGNPDSIPDEDKAFIPGTDISVNVLFFNDLLEAYEIMKDYWKKN